MKVEFKNIDEFIGEDIYLLHPKYGKGKVVAADFINEIVLINFFNFGDIQMPRGTWNHCYKLHK